MKTKLTITTAIALFISLYVQAQNTFPSTGSAGIGTTTPAASAALEIKSTNQGLLIPRMTYDKRNLIQSPATGLMIYQTNNTPGFYYYSGTGWSAISAQGANRNLSNLIATSVNQSLVPSANGAIDLGDATKGWNKLYLNGDIFNNGNKMLSASSTNVSVGLYSLLNSINVQNTAVGYAALSTNTVSANNTAVGSFSMYSSTGYDNSVFGEAALYSSSGNDNSAFGYQAMTDSKSGSFNCAFGTNVLAKNNGDNNIGIGKEALLNNNKGYNNIAVGAGALALNDSGNRHIAIGAGALGKLKNSTGIIAIGDSALYNYSLIAFNSNTAIGYRSMYATSTGNGNTAVGFSALASNTTGSSNIANGSYALSSNIDGSGNTAVGNNSMSYNDHGSDNTTLGVSALYFSTNGNRNVAVGSGAMLNNTSGSSNVAIGASVLSSNKTGSNSIAIGDSALSKFNAANSFNTAVGYKALVNNVNGNGNTANGFQSLYSNTGGNNTAIGYRSLYNNTTGTNNTAVGYNAYPINGAVNNYTGIGYNVGSSSSASNMVEIGNTSVTVIRGAVNMSTYSDKRIKNEIKSNVPGLAFINQLKPVTYKINLIKEAAIMYKNGKYKDSVADKDYAGRDDLARQVKTGFLAQEVEAAAKKINYDFSGIVKPQNEHDLYSLRYAEFVVPLVKAVQELSKMNDDKDAKIDNLQRQIDELKALIASSHSLANSQLSTSISSASLSQNVPNPFSNTTTINYLLPSNYSSAKLIITDKNDNALKQINLTAKGNGSIKVDASSLASGAYQYSLYVNNKLVDTKQLTTLK